MNSNPIMQLLFTHMRGGDVISEVGRMAQANPKIAQASKILSNNRGNLENYARNMGKSNGIDVDAMYRNLRQQINR